MAEGVKIVGLVAEFKKPEDLLTAAKKAYSEGYRKMDAHSPFPIHGLAEAIGFTKNAVPKLTLLAGLCGGTGGFFLQYWCVGIAYPLNIAGKPFFSWPSFIPVTFECTVLLAAFTAALGMLALNGLPQPYHPLFNVDAFAKVTDDRFFLYIESQDPKFDVRSTKKFLEGTGSGGVYEVTE